MAVILKAEYPRYSFISPQGELIRMQYSSMYHIIAKIQPENSITCSSFVPISLNVSKNQKRNTVIQLGPLEVLEKS